MDFLEDGWREPDEGIWEVRGRSRHFVHSKVMAWVAVDRAVQLVEARPGCPAPVDRWQAMRDAVHAEVLAHGYDDRRGAFIQYYGGRELDAATLFVVKIGFLPPDDPRVVRTVEAVRDGLDHDGFVHRYALGGSTVSPRTGLPGCRRRLRGLLVLARRRAGRDRPARRGPASCSAARWTWATTSACCRRSGIR